MWEDPIVAEVRRVRMEIEKECDADFAQIYKRAQELEKSVTNKVVSRPAERMQRQESVIIEARELPNKALNPTGNKPAN